MSDELSTQPSYRFSIVPEWVIFEQRLDAHDVRVYAALARYGPRSFPSIGSLASRLMLSESTIRRGLGRLSGVGAVRVEPRFDGERQTSNLYVLAGDEPMGVTSDTLPPVTSDTLPPVTGDTRRKARKNESKKEETSSSSGDDELFATMFDIFWKMYPRKVGKPAALKAYKKAHGETGSGMTMVIQDGLGKWVDYWTRERTETRFIPHPATWLNRRGWEDEPPAEKAPEPVVQPTAVPADMLKAWNEIERWLLGQGERGRLLVDNKFRILTTFVRLRGWGYGLGETLIRLALAIRYAPDYALCWDPKYLADDQHRVIRFEGMPMDLTTNAPDYSLVECMERAYDAQRWGK